MKNGTWWAPSLGGPGTGNKRVRDYNLTITKMAFKGGVKMLSGTDWPGGGFSFGRYDGADRTVLDELIGLVEAGLTPQEALKTSITNPIALFKLQSQLGTVEKGKIADLDLLERRGVVASVGKTRMASRCVTGESWHAHGGQKPRLLPAGSNSH